MFNQGTQWQRYPGASEVTLEWVCESVLDKWSKENISLMHTTGMGNIIVISIVKLLYLVSSEYKETYSAYHCFMS